MATFFWKLGTSGGFSKTSGLLYFELKTVLASGQIGDKRGTLAQVNVPHHAPLAPEKDPRAVVGLWCRLHLGSAADSGGGKYLIFPFTGKMSYRCFILTPFKTPHEVSPVKVYLAYFFAS